MKRCTRCNEDKALHLFQRRAASKDGYTASCKSCLSNYDKKRANLPHRVKARKEYSKTDEGKRAKEKANKNWLEKNPKKRACHIIVGNLIRSGVIKKKGCEICGDVIVHAHHDDYDKPDTIRWLCNEHHNEWHQINGEGLNP